MADVVIAGGGIMGCATAVHLLTASPGLDVRIVEPDPTYAKAATGRGTGGVRQLFARPENILLSQYTLDIIEDWNCWAAIDGNTPPSLDWQPAGYLFVAGHEDVDDLAANFQTQRAHNVPVHWLDPDDLAGRYPQVHTADLAGAALSPRDGWLNAKAFFAGVRAKAASLGAVFVTDRVVDFTLAGTAVRSVALGSGRVLTTDAVVNAAGTWAPELTAKVGMPVPVEPMRRHEHHVQNAADLDHLPFVKDVAGLAIHPYGRGLSVGLVDFDHPGGANFDIDHNYFDRAVAPALTHRIRAGADFTLRETWTGLYAQNRFDGNMIVGNLPGHLDNFHIATGFSGHGFMHALGVGRGLTELILHGHYTTVDLQRMSYQRIIDDKPYPEYGIR